MEIISFKKQVSSILLIFITLSLYAQSFVNSGISFPGISEGAVAWGDYDNDGDPDILITGKTSSVEISSIYRNDCNGIFIESGIPLTPVWRSSCDWGDYDNDGDLDILLAGQSGLYTQGSETISKIYRNDGGIFTEQTGIILIGIQRGSAKWVDYDNNGNLDVLLTGATGNDTPGEVTKIYHNNGDNSFTQVQGTGLAAVYYSSADCGDYDNDGYQDIILAGLSSSMPIAQIYHNNGDGTFSSFISLEGVSHSSCAWCDYDCDGDLDVVLSGEPSQVNTSTSRLYRNDGGNIFSYRSVAGLYPFRDGSLAWNDYDNDGFPDLFMTGTYNTTGLFHNNGGVTFSMTEDPWLEILDHSSVAWADYDNDGDADILLSGMDMASQPVTRIYRNESIKSNNRPGMPGNLSSEFDNGIVTLKWDKATDTETLQDGLTYNLYIYENGQPDFEFTPHSFRESDPGNGKRLVFSRGKIQWSSSGTKINSLEPGKTYFWSVQTIDAGLSGGLFSPEQSFTVPAYRPVVQASSLTFSDIREGSVNLSWVNGGGTRRVVFIKETELGTTDPCDNTTYNINDQTTGGWKCIYNNSGSSVVLSGLSINTYYTIQVCEYNGSPGNELYLRSVSYFNPGPLRVLFTEQTSIVLPGVNNGGVSWGDYNSDGNMDILLTGWSNELGQISKIFRNKGDNTFELDVSLPGAHWGSSEWGDFDNDNSLDILFSGYDLTINALASKVFHNDGVDGFIEETETNLIGAGGRNSASWCDYNNDGFPDILVSGISESIHSVTKVYRNNKDRTFTEQATAALPGASSGAHAWIDYDKNGYPDFVISGISNNQIFSKIFRNNSDGTFSEQDINLTGLLCGSASGSDFDNDGLPDIFITGNPDLSASHPQSILYRNNGDGTFVQLADINLKGVSNGSLSWGDYDNDGYQDILLTGESGNRWITLIYHNNGDGTFSEQKGFSLPPVYYGNGLWSDYDNDGDLDILLNGRNDEGHLVSRIFRNEIPTKNTCPDAPSGLQSFWEHDQLIFKWNAPPDNTTPESAMNYNIRIGIDPGGTEIRSPEALATGKLLLANPNNLINDTRFAIKLPVGNYYWAIQSVDKGNMGSLFTAEQVTSADSIQACALEATKLSRNSLSVKWKNGNGTRRVLFCRVSSSDENAKPAQNISYHAESFFGEGDKIDKTGWYCMFDGKADSTVLYGLHEGYSYDIQIIEYINTVNGPVYFRSVGQGNPWMFSTSLFSGTTGIDIPSNFAWASNAWADFNNDGYLDLVVTGSLFSGIFLNEGDGSFSKQDIPLQGVAMGSADWCDYDNDGYLDLLVTGATDYYGHRFSGIYKNNGINFTWRDDINLTPVANSCAVWGDYNNDGFADILLTGQDGLTGDVTTIYLNNGNGGFTELSDAGIAGASYGSAAWGDYDNDGLQDILLTNSSAGGAVYRNEGNGVFTKLQLPYTSKTGSFMDYNHDRYDDILLSGLYGDPAGLSRLYHNNKNNSFTELSDIKLAGMSLGSAAWGDHNNDSHPDILLTGNSEGVMTTKLYGNNGNNSFIEVEGSGLPGVSQSDGIWGDYDNDGDADILLTGVGTTLSIFRNNLIMRAGDYSPNMKPEAPSGLSSGIQPGIVELSWSPVTKDETPASGLTYNVRIGTTEMGSDIVSPLSDVYTGFRKVARYGNAQFDTIFIITGLPSGTYYWSVQAVDNCFSGGDWSVVSSFTVKQTQAFFTAETVCEGNPTSFSDLSIAEDGISSWKWDFNDGSASTDQNPAHIYAQSGTYNVKLVITDTGGTNDSLVQAVVVKPKPLTNINAESVCQGIPVTATNLTNNNDLTISSWEWDFGDGSTSSAEQPAPHPYLVAADYTIKLKVTASNGCADSVSKVVSVGSYPVAAVTANAPLTFCKGDSVKLSVPAVPGYIYNWKLSGTSITGAAKNELIARNSGSYVAEITNPKGNCTSVSPPAAVTALDAPVAPLILTEGQLVFCQGDSVKLSVAASAGNKYYWKLNGGTVGADLNTYYAKTSGDYSLTLLNPSGCSAGSVNKITVTVNPKPSVPDISKSGPATFCEGGSLMLSVRETAGNIYSWRNQDGPLAGSSSTTYTAISTGTYSLDISNSSGCSVRTEPVNVLVKKAPAIPLLDSANFTKGKCPGENPVRLTARNANPDYKYSWFRNGEPLPADTLSALEFYEAGNYMLRATLEGCAAESKVIKADFPEGLPKPVIHAQGPTLWYLACDNTTAARYMWYFNGKLIEGADKYYYVANYKLGKYQVSIASRDGCYTKSDIITIPPGYTGIDEEDPFNTLVVYPNPSKGGITVEMNNSIHGDILIEIFSQTGKKLLSKRFDKATLLFKASFDLTGQPEGLYVINLSLNKYFAVKKIMIE